METGTENETELNGSEPAPFSMTHASSLAEDGTQMAPMADTHENHILFVDHLPSDTTEGILALIFQSCPGYKEVRLIPGQQERKAFVEFASVEQATSAMGILNGYRISNTHQLHVSYAKK